MSSAREVRQRISSVKNIAQVTRALQAVSRSKARKSMQAVMATRPYASKAWQVLTHIAAQPGHESLHPLLAGREEVRRAHVVLLSGDRGWRVHTTPISSASLCSTLMISKFR
jgi:F-type H+-transporting ATPase subunit gamma